MTFEGYHNHLRQQYHQRVNFGSPLPTARPRHTALGDFLRAAIAPGKLRLTKNFQGQLFQVYRVLKSGASPLVGHFE